MDDLFENLIQSGCYPDPGFRELHLYDGQSHPAIIAAKLRAGLNHSLCPRETVCHFGCLEALSCPILRSTLRPLRSTGFIYQRLRHKPRQAASTNQAAWQKRAKTPSYFTPAFGTIARGAGMKGQMGKWKVP
jgi:hypothetical protein